MTQRGAYKQIGKLHNYFVVRVNCNDFVLNLQSQFKDLALFILVGNPSRFGCHFLCAQKRLSISLYYTLYQKVEVIEGDV